MSVSKEAWARHLALTRVTADDMTDRIKELSGGGIVEDYLLDLYKATKFPDKSRKYLKRADVALENMTSRAADKALKLAGQLGLPWDLLSRVDAGWV